jgi:glutathione S-transferase
MGEPIKLFVVPASHPCVAVEAALRLKGLEYEREDLAFGLSNFKQVMRFGNRTVPAVTIGRHRVTGSRLIMRTLEGIQPDPRLVPSDPELRARVDEADEWGDFVLQEQTRWIVLAGVAKHPEAFASFNEGYNALTLPDFAVKRASAGVALEARLLGHGGRAETEYLPALPDHLDKVDGWIAQGVLGGSEPNVADLQIAASVRLLMNLEDLRPGIEVRPAGELATRLIPDYPGHVPAGALTSPFAGAA